MTVFKWRHKTEINWLSSNDVTKPKLIKTLRVDFLQVTQFFFWKKSDQHDQWNVLNLLTYNFGMKNNFEQGGIWTWRPKNRKSASGTSNKFCPLTRICLVFPHSAGVAGLLTQFLSPDTNLFGLSPQCRCGWPPHTVPVPWHGSVWSFPTVQVWLASSHSSCSLTRVCLVFPHSAGVAGLLTQSLSPDAGLWLCGQVIGWLCTGVGTMWTSAAVRPSRTRVCWDAALSAPSTGSTRSRGRSTGQQPGSGGERIGRERDGWGAIQVQDGMEGDQLGSGRDGKDQCHDWVRSGGIWRVQLRTRQGSVGMGGAGGQVTRWDETSLSGPSGMDWFPCIVRWAVSCMRHALWQGFPTWGNSSQGGNKRVPGGE